MSGRTLFWILCPALALALIAQAAIASRVLRASRIVRVVEATSLQAANAGEAGQKILRLNLGVLREALELDPASAAAAQATGSVYLLLGRPQQAIAAYQSALRLQPSAETYMNLGHANLAAGDLATSRLMFGNAIKLDSRLAAQIPAAAR